jgi:hypothetical protein
MNKSGLENELIYLITAKNHLWAAILGTFGGTIGLLLVNTNPYLKWTLFFTGLIFTFLLLDNYFRKDDKIEKIIEFLKYNEVN